MADITFREMLVEVRREIGARRSIYDRRILTGEMTKATAEYNIAVMQAIYDHLEPFAEDEQAEEDVTEPRMF